MSDLLARALSAHGGLARWQRVSRLRLDLDIRGNILLTKSDKLSRSRARQAEMETARAVSELDSEVTVQLFSSLKRTGVEQAREKIAEWLDDD